jgi:hypothetical protein
MGEEKFLAGEERGTISTLAVRGNSVLRGLTFRVVGARRNIKRRSEREGFIYGQLFRAGCLIQKV